MTVDLGQATLPPDPQASLRTELSGQLAVAQLALEAAIVELSRNGGDTATLAASRSQLSSVSDLLRQVGSASLARLTELRSEVTTTAASAAALANKATGNSDNSAAVDVSLTPAQRARAAIEAVGRDLFENKVLDTYLQFDSPDDEAAYRKREKERQEAYERALALHTPEGDRLAAQIQKAQIADAKANGAEGSPELARMEQQTDQASAAAQPANPVTDRAPDSAKSSDGSRAAAAPMEDVFASLKAAGVVAPVDSAPADGHGVTLTAANDGPKRNVSGRG